MFILLLTSVWNERTTRIYVQWKHWRDIVVRSFLVLKTCRSCTNKRRPLMGINIGTFRSFRFVPFCSQIFCQIVPVPKISLRSKHFYLLAIEQTDRVVTHALYSRAHCNEKHAYQIGFIFLLNFQPLVFIVVLKSISNWKFTSCFKWIFFHCSCSQLSWAGCLRVSVSWRYTTRQLYYFYTPSSPLASSKRTSRTLHHWVCMM